MRARPMRRDARHKVEKWMLAAGSWLNFPNYRSVQAKAVTGQQKDVTRGKETSRTDQVASNVADSTPVDAPLGYASAFGFRNDREHVILRCSGRKFAKSGHCVNRKKRTLAHGLANAVPCTCNL